MALRMVNFNAQGSVDCNREVPFASQVSLTDPEHSLIAEINFKPTNHKIRRQYYKGLINKAPSDNCQSVVHYQN
jgi:hypothetical protein